MVVADPHGVGAVAAGAVLGAGPGPSVAAQLGDWTVDAGQYTTAEQYALTTVVGLLFALLLVVLYAGGRVVERRYGGDVVHAVQGTVVTVASLVCSGYLVLLWDQEGAVVDALAFLTVTPGAGVRALVTFVVLVAGYTVTRLTKRTIKYGAGRWAITPHQREVAHHLVQIVVVAAVVAFTVALWGVDPRNLFLGAGVIGIVLGFAARKTLSGVLAGFFILFARPFEVGDWVRIGDREGIVTDVTVYNTTVRTFDEEHVLVPNDTVTQNEVINYSKTRRLRLHTDVGVDYGADVGRAAAVAAEAMADLDEVADRPAPDVVRREFGDSAVVLRLRYWIDTPSIEAKWRAQNAVVEAVKAAFEREGIAIPFPQRELSGREAAGGLRVAAADGERVDGDGGDGEQVDGEPVEGEQVDDERVDGATSDDRDLLEVDGPTSGAADGPAVQEPVEADYRGDPREPAGTTPEPQDGPGSDGQRAEADGRPSSDAQSATADDHSAADGDEADDEEGSDGATDR